MQYGQTESNSPQNEDNPWAAAFAALENSGNSEAAEGTDGESAEGSDSNGGEEMPDGSDSGSFGDVDDGAAGLGDDDQVLRSEDGAGAGSPFDLSEEDIESYRASWEEDVKDKAVEAMAKEFVKKGIRNNNGKLGATIYDSDIYRKESDGTVRFFNPETGREFNGDNPRKQAQEWVDDYNAELAKAFNGACEKYAAHLMKTEAAPLAVIEFAPKYKALDPIRRAMFDEVIGDYEITGEDGNVIGYSVDLNKALAMVDRQVSAIQGYAKANPRAATTPALDMKSSSSAITSQPKEFTSLAEAMEYQQNLELEKLRSKKSRR